MESEVIYMYPSLRVSIYLSYEPYKEKQRNREREKERQRQRNGEIRRQEWEMKLIKLCLDSDWFGFVWFGFSLATKCLCLTARTLPPVTPSQSIAHIYVSFNSLAREIA